MMINEVCNQMNPNPNTVAAAILPAAPCDITNKLCMQLAP